MILWRRLARSWPDGVVGLDRSRWVTGLVAAIAFPALGLGLAIGVTLRPWWQGAVVVAVFGLVTALVYRLDSGLFAVMDSDGIRGRSLLPGSSFQLAWSEIVWIGWADAFVPVPQKVLGVALTDHRFIALPSTLSPLWARKHQDRLIEIVKSKCDVADDLRLPSFGPLLRHTRWES